MEGEGDCGEATPCAEGDGAPPQRKRQRVSRGKGRSSESVSALRDDKENGSDAKCPVVDGIPDRVEPSTGCAPVPVTCWEPVSSSQGDTAMDFSEPSKAVGLNNISPIKSEPSVLSDLSIPRYDSDSDDDDDLPSVSVSFGTPTHEGLKCKSYHSQIHIANRPVPSSLPTNETLSPPSSPSLTPVDSIVEGTVYWVVYPRYPPWPALVGLPYTCANTHVLIPM